MTGGEHPILHPEEILALDSEALPQPAQLGSISALEYLAMDPFSQPIYIGVEKGGQGKNDVEGTQVFKQAMCIQGEADQLCQ
jgi:hypothetical protein